jgi:hypothetical protein
MDLKASYTGYVYSSIAALAITTAAIDTAITNLRTITAPQYKHFLVIFNENDLEHLNIMWQSAATCQCLTS